MNTVYRTITGRTITLDKLSEPERALLRQALDQVRKTGWNRFAAWWVKTFNASGLDEGSVVFRICRDLESRLGIGEGKVAAPDYRDSLADLIEERYGSRSKFCAETGIDPGQLSRVFSGKADLSLELLKKALSALEAQLVVFPSREAAQRFSREEAVEALAAGVR